MELIAGLVGGILAYVGCYMILRRFFRQSAWAPFLLVASVGLGAAITYGVALQRSLGSIIFASLLLAIVPMGFVLWGVRQRSRTNKE
jgi:hypothetical protein